MMIPIRSKKSHRKMLKTKKEENWKVVECLPKLCWNFLNFTCKWTFFDDEKKFSCCWCWNREQNNLKKLFHFVSNIFFWSFNFSNDRTIHFISFAMERMSIILYPTGDFFPINLNTKVQRKINISWNSFFAIRKMPTHKNHNKKKTANEKFNLE